MFQIGGIMRAVLLALISGVIVSCGPSLPTPENDAADDLSSKAPIAMTLTDGGKGDWSLKIEKKSGGEFYAFSRSENDYRSESWQVVSGADFSRKHGFDTLKLNANQAQLTFTPYVKSLPGTYTPFINFSDGGTAVFAGQFDLFALEDDAGLKALGGDVYNNEGELFAAPLTLKSARPILYGGQSYDGEVTLSLDGKSSYAYIGDTDITQGKDFSGVIDPGLPDWISQRFDEDLSLVFNALAERWGFDLPQKGTILLAFEGYEDEGVSLTGGALPGNMIVMQLSGERLREENPRVTSYLKWFFIHEAVHLFQKKTDKSYAHNRYSWISEGGANTMTSMIMAENDLALEGYLLRIYGDSFEFCAQALEGKTLEAAIDAGPEGNYDCGDLIGRITDAALPRHDYFEFWNSFLAGLDENFTDADYFAAMRKLGADEDIVSRLEALTSDPVIDAEATLKSLMNDVGIDATFADGAMRAIAFPN